MRISIVANCQGEGIESAIKAINPNLDASFKFITEIRNGSVDIDEIFENSDYIFLQRNLIDSIAEKFLKKTLYFPNIVFDGYHPDISFIRGVKKGDFTVETVASDMVIYHSAIAFYGYYFDISIDDILTYYNHHVSSRLGYLDRWRTARTALLAEGEAVGMPLAAEFHRWSSQGCFMYSSNHPHLRVLVDLARRMMAMIGVEAIHRNVVDYIPDALRAMPIWPIYPPIAQSLGLDGDYTFKRHDPHSTLTLRQFVEQSYATYDQYERESLESLTISPTQMAQLLYNKSERKITQNPYKSIDPRQFWKNSVSSVDVGALDPVLATGFQIGKNDKVATAGSCFAQHIARTLSRSGFNYHVTEAAPQNLSAETAHNRNFGVFSARYGNVYTVRQLVQLIDRAYGRYTPDEHYWTRPDGKYVDPFRPQIEPDGFEDIAGLEASRKDNLAAVRAMLESMDIFVFTLGLTESWRSKVDGAVFPLAPGVAGGEMDFDRYEFVNFTAAEVTFDLMRAIDLIRAVNRDCRIILTVSPVPLIATYEPQHALISTTYSKSVLRVAAEHASADLKHVDYFGSYEIITGAYNRGAYFLDDLRSVTDNGVAHVMQVFMKHYAKGSTKQSSEQGAQTVPTPPDQSRKLFDIVCDEEAIAKF